MTAADTARRHDLRCHGMVEPELSEHARWLTREIERQKRGTMKAGDIIYRVRPNVVANALAMHQTTIKTVRKDGTVMINEPKAGWNYSTIVPAKECSASPAAAAMAYLAANLAGLDSARAQVSYRERLVDVARAFAAAIERGG